MTDEMERVDSSAMKSLAAYADSDEEIDEAPRSPQDFFEGGGDNLVGAAVNRRRTVSNVDIEKAQMPEAPDSYGEDEDSSDSGSDENDNRKSAGGRRSPWISDDDGNDSGVLKEPPPPARPRAFYSPSPSSSRDSTPLAAGKGRPTTSFPRLPSSQALVSYQAEDEDEYHNRLSLEGMESNITILNTKNGRMEHLGSPNDENSTDAFLNAENEKAREHKMPKNDDGAEDIDVEALLETPATFGVSSTKAGSDSPRDIIVPENVQLPPEPAQKCSEELREKFRGFVEKRKKFGYNFNAAIQNRKDFRNPSIYSKLIEHFGIDEIGSNFSKNIFDPHGFLPSDFYDELGAAQKALMEKGTEKDTKPKMAANAVAREGEEKKRRSKWDNPGGAASSQSQENVQTSSGPTAATAGKIIAAKYDLSSLQQKKPKLGMD